MKKISFLLFCLCINKLNAQNNATLAVYYNFTHMRDTTMPDKLYKENMQLLISTNVSKYFSSDKAEADSLRKAQIEGMLKKAEQEGVMPNLDMRTMKQATAEIIFKENNKPNVDIQREFNKVNYLFEDLGTVINWKIEEETKKIYDLNCQKAIGNFRGRTYEVWFCADLPYNFGPWKLNGLPGLIIEAYDTKKQVMFTLQKIENCSERNIALQPSSAVSKVTKKDFDQMVSSFRDAFFAGAGADGVKVTVTKAAPLKGVPTLNNPIELTK